MVGKNHKMSSIYNNSPINNRWNGKRNNTFFKKLADKLSRKSGQRYSEAISFIRKIIRFDLLRTTMIALRGE